jgi:uncharacterized protein
MKFLIWLVIGAAVVTWVMRLKSGLAAAQREVGEKAKPPGGRIESMLQCARCGVHFPASEAVTDLSGAHFCCEEHRAQRDVR